LTQGGLENYTSHCGARGPQGSIPGSGKDFYVCFFVLKFVVVILLICSKHILLSSNLAISFAMLIYLLNIQLNATFLTNYKGIKIQTS